MVEEDESVALPDGVDTIWRAFWDLSMARGSSGFGPAAIGYRDIEAYARLHRFEFTSWEVETITIMDLLWRADQALQAKESRVEPTKLT